MSQEVYDRVKGWHMENEEVEEYEETKAPQGKDYFIYKEQNGKVIKLPLEMKLIQKRGKISNPTKNEPWHNNWRHKTNF